MDKLHEFARRVEERDVRFIGLWFTDVLGTLKSVAIAPAELEAAFEEGLGFDGSAVEGLTRVSEDDMIVKPDRDVPDSSVARRPAGHRAHVLRRARA